MKLDQIKTFDGLAAYVRTFANGHGDPSPYDFAGVLMLVDAILENLTANDLDADLKSLQDTGCALVKEEQRFLEQMLKQFGGTR